MKKVLLLVTLALALPATARAGNVTMVWRDVPLGPRALQAAPAPIRFDMLGVHWQGPGIVFFRTRLAAAGWSGWTAADGDSGQYPGSREDRSGPWRDGSLAWTGAANAV